MEVGGIHCENHSPTESLSAACSAQRAGGIAGRDVVLGRRKQGGREGRWGRGQRATRNCATQQGVCCGILYIIAVLKCW